ncbi:MAG: hypothetical protein RL683_504 [Actinomycetota bacterium]
MSNIKIIDWRAAKPSPLMLLSGAETYFSDEVIRRLKDVLRNENPGLEIFDISASDYEGSQLLGMITPSLFSDPKLVIIRDVERCTDALIEDGKQLAIEDLIDVTLVLQHSGTTVRGKALLEHIRTLSGAVEVNCAKLQYDKDKSAFVQSHFTEAGRKFSSAAVQSLVDAFNSDVSELAAACDQLLVDSSELVDEALVDKYFGGRMEVNATKIFNAASEGRGGDALLLLRHATQTGQDVIPLLAGFGARLRQMARLHSDPRVTPQSAGMNTWQFNQARQASSSWDDEGLSRALRLLADADAAAKGGERDSVYRTEQLLLLIAARGRA